ncbi:Tfp pilus tip-associated adhesin PilY1 [Variovorax boronicumulans]|uniref:Tfp pilus tip-associated adhesin PilY1 n=1 Tax=Variovorax boronicumulans TaxID=436515 RepID=A0AAW8E5K0_9BURK|nr:PilC/PilY family type IV pilus protein [Variovorax boronicumulans]MDP9881175.1 Tfp pilus tip-associated adhesin PilY1 [Variovorax boronicumulans]MDP9926462.1 Tfp pilus tip-associated adhesin PilY1 [Variovorax boronicumulans]
MTVTRPFLVQVPARAARTLRTFVSLAAAWGAAVLPLGDALAATTPSQTPLYNAVPGAKPNLMFVLDNSGSMDDEMQDGYAVNDQCKEEEKDCRGKYGWYSMRSSNINTQYYNPAITYSARVDATGKEKPNPVSFVNNQSSTDRRPLHEAGTTTSTKKFTYVLCKNNDCSSEANRTVSTIGALDVSNVPLPPGHKRTDCGSANECTAVLERKNIANWYTWYRNRALAVSTALGLAMQSYDNKFRVGYVQYNQSVAEVDPRNPAKPAEHIVSGVNYFKDESTASGQKWKSRFYSWIYDIVPNGGTPSHNALRLAADYYAGKETTTYAASSLTHPWKNDPNDATSGELSCRRAYAIVLSDGAWNSGTAQDIDTRFTATTTSTNYDGKPSGSAAKFKYDPKGAPARESLDLPQRLSARNLYIPYSDGGTSSNGFADLTARYFWHTDFSNTLSNDVPPVEGQHNPTFWQNMTTYTIGWGLTPSGDSPLKKGLTWAQIEKYNSDWLAGNPVTPPQWATGDLNRDSSDAGDARRVDDFIRAGFTGGGRAYSVYSGEDVRRALDNALSSMVGSGNDAGVAVSGNSNEFQTLQGQYKYTTEYQTADNSGDIKAFALNADGANAVFDDAGKPKPAWSANARMPAVDKRTILALSNYDPNAPGSAQRTALTYGTRLSDLPNDLQALLNADKQQATDERFVRYLLGEDPQKDAGGTVYRLRRQPIGASVNSPPVFVGGRFDMGYGTFGAVDGKDTYPDYKALKTTRPPTIFAATNNGKVHVLNAGRNDAAGGELAAFMPKGAMASQIDLAGANFRFRYTLDGPLVEQDVYDKNGQTPAGEKNTWRQLVLGTGGRAGPFMYGLESPLNNADRTPGKEHFLWEVNNKHKDYPHLSHVTNNPAAGQLDDGTWVMLTGNGHYPETQKVGLYVVEALTGKLKQFIQLPTGYGGDATGGNRGLGGVVAVRDSTRRIVAAYAGDANGNLWRFDLRSAKLAASVPRRLFTTPSGKKQPIYAAPTWQVHPGDGSTCTYSATSQCGAIVVIGTGILLDEDDLAMPATKQALYGLWDQTPIGGDDKAGAVALSTSNLVTQTIIPVAKTGAGIEEGKDFYQLSTNAVDWKTKKGWQLNLGTITHPGAMANGERVVGDLANLGSSVIVSSFLPEDKKQGIESCTATGSLPNIIYVLDALTGKNKNSFDVDGNGSFDAYSVVSIPSGGFTRGNVNSRNMVGQPNEGQPDGRPRSSCTNETGFLTGVGGTQKAGDGCPDSRTWRRSWRQVVSPPF